MTAVQKRLKMALDRQKEAADKRSTQQQQQQKQAEGLVPRMKVIMSLLGKGYMAYRAVIKLCVEPVALIFTPVTNLLLCG